MGLTQQWVTVHECDSRGRIAVPIAGPKGYGLAVMVEVLSALLSGAGYGSAVGFPNKGEHEDTGFAITIIDPSRFRRSNSKSH